MTQSKHKLQQYWTFKTNISTFIRYIRGQYPAPNDFLMNPTPNQKPNLNTISNPTFVVKLLKPEAIVGAVNVRFVGPKSIRCYSYLS